MNGHSNEQEHQNGDLHKRSLGQFILESWGKKKQVFAGQDAQVGFYVE